jgi:rhodanese-related sulfurtransferase
MRRAFFEAITILVVALTLALIVNGLRPGGIRIVRAPEKIIDNPAGSDAPAVISLADAVVKYNAGRALFIDARSPEDFSAGHIEGALNLPALDFENRVAQFFEQVDPDFELITYCDGPDCPLAKDLSEYLMESGFEHVSFLLDGWGQWKSEKLPVVMDD